MTKRRGIYSPHGVSTEWIPRNPSEAPYLVIRKIHLQVGACKGLPTNHPAITSTGTEEHMDSLADYCLTIVRCGDPDNEHAVQVRQGRDHWWINPRTEVGLAVAPRYISRAGCIQCFASGLVASGHRVFIQENRQRYLPETYEFRVSLSYQPAYFAFGLAYGLNQWRALSDVLIRDISPERRLAVLEETGRFYQRNHYWRTLSLQFPVA